MSGCSEYQALLEVLAQKLSSVEISALLSKASKGLVNILSEITENLCCVEGALTEAQKKELSKFRSVIKIVSCNKRSFKCRRMFAIILLNTYKMAIYRSYSCPKTIVC